MDKLSFAYNSETILEEESFELSGEGLVTVLGPNGAGKTTFFRILLGLLKPQKGRVLVNGVDVTGDPLRAGRFMSYVPQLSHIDFSFPITGRELVESAVKSVRRCKSSECREAAEEYLAAVGALDFADKRLGSLSGGQLQRILIARALARQTPIMILDEPFSGVDPRGREKILDLILSISGGKMVLLSTHDPVLTINASKEIIVFNRGVKAIGTPREVFKLDLLRKAYGDGVVMIEKCLHVIA